MRVRLHGEASPQRHFALVDRDGRVLVARGEGDAIATWVVAPPARALHDAASGQPVPDEGSPHAALRAGRALDRVHLRLTEHGRDREARVTVTPVPGLALAAIIVEPVESSFSRHEFLAVATHELKSPIAAIHLDLERIRRKFHAAEQVSGAEVAREMERANRQVTRLMRLMQNFTDASQLQNGLFALRVDTHDLCAIVADVVDGLAPLAARARCALHVACCDPVPGAWDKLRIEQVVHNLTMNALKYAADGASIEVQVVRRGQAAQLRVVDHGPGVAEREREAIFQPFVRATSDHPKQSLGLGLYVVREIVAAHGGRAWVEPTEGGGATFVAELPLSTTTPDQDG